MTALTDIQRALNIIRKIVDAEPKTLGLDALVLTNQTAASIGYALKDKPQTPKPRSISAPIRNPEIKAAGPRPVAAQVKRKSAIRTGIDLAPIRPRAPLPSKPLT